MAQYDGSIRINTEILVKSAEKQLRALENNMEKTAEKAASLHDKMKAMRSMQISTQQYAELDKELSRLGAEYEKIAERQQKFLETGGKERSSAYKKMEYDLNNLDKKQDEVIAKMKELEASGKAFISASSTEEYSKLGQQLKYLEAAQEVMNQQHVIAESRLETALQKREAEREKLRETISEEMHLAEIRRNATVADQELIDLLERRKEVMQEIADMQKANVGEGYQEYYDAQSELSGINEQINAIREARAENENMQSSWQRLKEVSKETLKTMAKGLVNIPIAIVKAGINSIISVLKQLGKAVQNSAVAPFKLLKVIAKKAFSSIGNGAKSSNNMFNKGFKNILKYGLGIRSVYALINKLRTAVKEGFKNLAQVSAPVNASLSALKSSLTQLKNSLATAFAPILTTIAPLLTSLINMLSKAATYVGMFMAAVTGKNSFVKAVAVQEDYAASLDATSASAKKAAKALAGFDKLNVLNQNDSDGGGTGGTSPGDMFEEVSISDNFKDIAKQLKDMWEASDFYDLGKILGEKLKEALDNIHWDTIKEKARKVGKRLATLINGFIEVDGLGYSIGRTLAEAFNTGFEFLNAFVHELHWDSLGKFIAETLNGIFENIDWDLIYDTFVTGAKGLGDAINSFADNLNWDAIATTISNFVNTFVDTIYTFITTIDWKKLGTDVGKTISDAWTEIDWKKAGETLSKIFIAFFDFVGKAIEAVDWEEVGKSVKDFLTGIDWAGVAESFFEAVGAAFGGLAAFLKGVLEDAVIQIKEYFLGYILDELGRLDEDANILEIGYAVIRGMLKGILDAIGAIADWIYENIFIPFIDGFKAAFGIHSPSTVMEEMGTYIVQGLLDGIASLVDKVTETWESMKGTAMEIWDNVKESLSEKWKSMKETASDIFNSMKEKVSGIWDGLWSNIKGVINSILGGVESMANGVVSAINTIIRALNGLSFDIPDWLSYVPGMSNLGGKMFGFNIGEIPKVNIPRLADGAVIRGGDPFMAVLGDQRHGQTNIEAPLATIRKAVREELKLQRNSFKDSGNGSYVFQVDGKTFFEITRSEAQRYFRRTGKSPYPT